MNPWLQTGLSVLVGLLTAGGALVGVRLSVRGGDRATEQRELAARREEWWRRFTWAAELALDSSPEKRVAGLQLMTKLAQSDLAGTDESLLLDAFHERVLTSLLASSQERQAGRSSPRPWWSPVVSAAPPWAPPKARPRRRPPKPRGARSAMRADGSWQVLAMAIKCQLQPFRTAPRFT